MDALLDIKEWFWNEEVWLPRGTTWASLKCTDEKTFGRAKDFLVVFPLAILVYCVRLFVEKFAAPRLWRTLLNNNQSSRSRVDNTVLEKVYTSGTKYPNAEQLGNLCRELKWSKQQVKTWFINRARGRTSATLTKFAETLWRFVFYLSGFTFGVYVLHDEECLWNTTKCWDNYPDDHQLTPKMYWYYMIELAFYTSTTATQFFDVKRKDFWEMFIHHIVTIILMFGSYTLNFTKMGAFIVLVHDSADFYLEFAKMAKYSKYKRTTNVWFGLFTIAFIISRLTILPLWIIPSVWRGGLGMYAPYSIMHRLFCALLLLQVLHFYWFWHIIRVVYSSILVGEIKRDTRSDSEEEHESGADNVNGKAAGDSSERNGARRRPRKT